MWKIIWDTDSSNVEMNSWEPSYDEMVDGEKTIRVFADDGDELHAHGTYEHPNTSEEWLEFLGGLAEDCLHVVGVICVEV